MFCVSIEQTVALSQKPRRFVLLWGFSLEVYLGFGSGHAIRLHKSHSDTAIWPTYMLQKKKKKNDREWLPSASRIHSQSLL